MSAHLRMLSRCVTCNAPATEQLYNGHNAPLGTYCTKHAPAALKAFQRQHERPA